MRKDARVGLLFTLPWILGFLIFTAYPVIASFYYSFTNYSVLRAPSGVGFANYKELAGDEVFRKTLANTLLYAIGAVPLSAVVAIGLAMLLNQKVKGMAVYRTMFFLPSLVPMVALGTLFLWVFNGDYGLLNNAFQRRRHHPAKLARRPGLVEVDACPYRHVGLRPSDDHLPRRPCRTCLFPSMRPPTSTARRCGRRRATSRSR